VTELVNQEENEEEAPVSDRQISASFRLAATLVERSRIDSDPRQSPFWIKAMGLLRWE
jgi:hypothetical protein